MLHSGPLLSEQIAGLEVPWEVAVVATSRVAPPPWAAYNLSFKITPAGEKKERFSHNRDVARAAGVAMMRTPIPSRAHRMYCCSCHNGCSESTGACK